MANIEKIIKKAIEAALPIYEDTQCYGAGCCGDFDGAIRKAVEVAVAEKDAENRTDEVQH